MVKRRRQKLKYYRYCVRKARQLMRSELRKHEMLAGRTLPTKRRKKRLIATLHGMTMKALVAIDDKEK